MANKKSVDFNLTEMLKLSAIQSTEIAIERRKVFDTILDFANRPEELNCKKYVLLGFKAWKELAYHEHALNHIQMNGNQELALAGYVARIGGVRLYVDGFVSLESLSENLLCPMNESFCLCKSKVEDVEKFDVRKYKISDIEK